MRKAFTPSEQVAIADAIAEKLAGRIGTNQHTSGHGNICTSSGHGAARDITAAKAGPIEIPLDLRFVHCRTDNAPVVG
jgi:hypothetical protein